METWPGQVPFSQAKRPRFSCIRWPHHSLSVDIDKSQHASDTTMAFSVGISVRGYIWVCSSNDRHLILLACGFTFLWWNFCALLHLHDACCLWLYIIKKTDMIPCALAGEWTFVQLTWIHHFPKRSHVKLFAWMVKWWCTWELETALYYCCCCQCSSQATRPGRTELARSSDPDLVECSVSIGLAWCNNIRTPLLDVEIGWRLHRSQCDIRLHVGPTDWVSECHLQSIGIVLWSFIFCVCFYCCKLYACLLAGGGCDAMQ